MLCMITLYTQTFPVTIDYACWSLYSCHLRWGRLDVVKFLVNETTADVNSKTNDGETPLDVAHG